MDIAVVSILIVVAMVGLLVAGVPLAFVSGAIAVVLAITAFGPDSLFLISSRTFEFLNSYTLVAVPMFVLMASVLERSGVARDLYRAFHVWAGGLPGGVAVMTTVVAVILGATTGIVGGEIVLLGIVALPQMLRLGYDRRLAIGTICAGGSLGTMIPPSIILIFYGITVNVSIGDLFLATAVPGLLLGLLYILYILARCRLAPELGPPAAEEDRNLPLAEKLALFKGVVLPLFVAACVLGSIYAGFASITESAAFGVAGVILSAWLRGELTWEMIGAALKQTLSTCGMVLWLVFGTNALIGVYNLMGGIRFAQGLFGGLAVEPMLVVLVAVGVFILLGFFIDWIGILLLTMPIFVPTIVKLGYDPVWFGVVFNMAMQVAYLTPPFGPSAFYLKSVAPPDISLQEIFSSMWPFIALQVVGLALVLVFPDLALWLPRLVYG
ncbi:MAG: TRAP transporter large permease subunit [Kiloniellales bacterium]|nr:TRAP transporter large permease subunit [Kiloniellales bacterium]